MSIKTYLVIALVALSYVSSAQEQKEVRKEVRMEDENGVKKLHIITTTNNQVEEEIYEGEEAEAKLNELMGGEAPTDQVKKEIEVTKINGETKVIIKSISGGMMTEEVYIGEEAENKLKELESAHSEKGEVHEIQIMEKEIKE